MPQANHITSVHIGTKHSLCVYHNCSAPPAMLFISQFFFWNVLYSFYHGGTLKRVYTSWRLPDFYTGKFLLHKVYISAPCTSETRTAVVFYTSVSYRLFLIHGAVTSWYFSLHYYSWSSFREPFLLLNLECFLNVSLSLCWHSYTSSEKLLNKVHHSAIIW